jgi:ATP-binding cassette subfamily C (CFTR/MRP) protein 10
MFYLDYSYHIIGIFPFIIFQVGIIGRTGAGKSSVLNVLFRLTPICGGCILVDGINIADVPVRDLRSHFSVVPQSPCLFDGSLR